MTKVLLSGRAGCCLSLIHIYHGLELVGYGARGVHRRNDRVTVILRLRQHIAMRGDGVHGLAQRRLAAV